MRRQPHGIFVAMLLSSALVAGTLASSAGSAGAQLAPGSPGALAALRPVVLEEGHIDLFEVTYDKDAEQLDLQLKDDTQLYDLDAPYRDPEMVTVAVDESLAAFSLEEVPPGYEFLGPAGTPLYMLDWSQQEGLPWPGWNTERFASTLPEGVVVPHERGAIQLSVEVEGPGDVFLFIPGDQGAEDKFIDTTDDQPEVIETLPGTHTHSSWVFTQPGDYELAVSPKATTTTGETLTGSTRSYHFHVGPRPDLPTQVSPQEFGASIAGVPDTVADGTEVDLELKLDQPRPEVAGYQWYRWIPGQQDVKIAGATGPNLSTTVDPWDSVYVALLDDTGRVLSVAYASFKPEPSLPDAPPNPTAWLEPNGKDVSVSWGTPGTGNSPLTSYVVTLTRSTGAVLSTTINDPAVHQTTFANVPAGTWVARVRATNGIGTGPESEPSPPVTVTGPEPEPKPSGPDLVPVPDEQLTDGSAGDVEVVASGTPFAQGAEITVRVGLAHAGQWVSPWLHSTPTWLDWAQVDQNGAIKIALPAGVAGGAHRLVVKSAAGNLIGWDALTVAAAPDRDYGPAFTTVMTERARQVYGRTAKLTVTVVPNATGTVVVHVPGAPMTATLSGGKATVALPAAALKPGNRTLAVTYAGVPGAFTPSAGTARVTVVKAKPQVQVEKLTPAVEPGSTASFRVRVSAKAVKPTGRVTVWIGGAKQTVKLSRKGLAVVKVGVARSAKPGQRTVVVTYAGDRYVARRTTSTQIWVAS